MMSATKAAPAASAAKASAVLTKATLKAADLLGLNKAALAVVIGVSESSVSRMAKGSFEIEMGSKPAELAALFVRLYRSLDAMVGNDEENRLAWMRSFNRAFGKAPREAIASVDGLTHVVRYLDAYRAVI